MDKFVSGEKAAAFYSLAVGVELMNIDTSFPHTEDVHTDPHYAYATPMGRTMRETFPFHRGSMLAQAVMTPNAFMILQLGSWLFVHGGISGLLDSVLEERFLEAMRLISREGRSGKLKPAVSLAILAAASVMQAP